MKFFIRIYVKSTSFIIRHHLVILFIQVEVKIRLIVENVPVINNQLIKQIYRQSNCELVLMTSSVVTCHISKPKKLASLSNYPVSGYKNLGTELSGLRCGRCHER